MGKFESYVKEHRVDLVRRSTVLEGYMFSRLETLEILSKGAKIGEDPTRVKSVINLNRAWSWILRTHGYHYMLVEDLHEIVSDEVTSERMLEGYMRPKRKGVIISGSTYVPPSMSREDSLEEFNTKFRFLDRYLKSNHSWDNKIDQVLYFYISMMKRQYFHDGNKRTSYLFTNYILKEYNLDAILYLPRLTSEGVFLKYLKNYYEMRGANPDGKFVRYLRLYYLKRI